LALSARHQSPPPALIAATVRRLQCSASAVKAATSRVLNMTWQCCRVHFQRNALAHALSGHLIKP
jgi:hypothetical protein